MFGIYSAGVIRMRIRSFLILLAVAGSAHASDGVNIGHRTDSGEAKPMAWRFSMLETAQEVFDKRAPERAPGATMRFRLPKVDAAQGGNQVELVGADHRVPLPMASNISFSLVRGSLAEDSDSMVVVNRNFPKGEYNHPLVQVRSPGLPDGVRRMGDLRLACAVQIEMAKTEGLKFRAVLTGASLFGLNVCDKLEAAKTDEPSGKFDTVTIEDGERRLVQPAKDKHLPTLGDKAWSDNARISYTLNGSPVE
jgi:hypothetical protein